MKEPASTPSGSGASDTQLRSVIEGLPHELFGTALRAAGVGAWQWDVASGRIWWSEGVEELFGLEPGEFAGSYDAYLALLEPSEREIVVAAVAATMAFGSSYVVEHRIVRRDGGVRWIEGRGQLIRDEAGRVLRLAGVVSDVTERQLARVRLAESEQRFRAFAEASFEAVVFGHANKVVDANQAACDLLGYSHDEIVGLRMDQLVAAQDVALVGERMRDGYAEAYEHCMLHKDGRVIEVEALGRNVRYMGLACRMTSLRDLGERKRAQSSLREREQMIRDLVDSSQDWIRSTDVLGVHTYCSVAVKGTLGREPSELEGHSCFDLLLPEDAERLRLTMQHSVRVRRGWSNLQLRWRHKDGSIRHLEGNASSVLDDAGNLVGFRVVERDVSERIQLQDEREDLERQLRHAQKMEAIGQLAGGVAHDFNNVLSVILGNGELAMDALRLRATDIDPEVIESIQEIQKSAERAAHLTRQLLSFSRQQVIKPVVLDLNPTLSQMYGLLRRLIREDIRLVLTCVETPLPVMADPGQFEQVLMNLVVNARDAMPRGGLLDITTSHVNLNLDEVTSLGLGREGHYALLCVTDTGTGMDSVTLERIFEPFFTTKPPGEGTGLGMATVYGIARQAGGKVAVESEPGKGTSVRVYWPLTQAQPLTEDVMPTPIAGGSESILVCEDEETVRRVSVRMLRAAGYKVLAAENGQQALELARAAPELALLLTDVIMPEMNGPELSVALQSVHPNVKVLFCSGYTADLIPQESVASGEVHFLAKPFTRVSLLERVREILDR